MNFQDYRHSDVKKLFRADPPTIPIWKRLVDLSCCLIALPLLFLVTVLMAILLRLKSRGPILFKQERIGYKGNRFMCYKFRTMLVGADTKSHQLHCDQLLGSRAPMPMVKLDTQGDNRVIPGAWVMRASGLDELPQVINIFRGEMTVVGPRPCLQYEYEQYERWQLERFKAVPGLTGLWQVSNKNHTTFDEMIELDIRYFRTSSLWLDLKIIMMTVPALIAQVAETRRTRKSLKALKRMPSSTPPTAVSTKRAPLPASL